MTATLRIARVNALPSVLSRNTLFLVDTANPTVFDFHLTSLDGQSVERGFSASDVNLILDALKTAPNGLATLDANGLIPSTQLPSYIDDVIEASNLAAFPQTGNTGKIYVTLDTNKTYRWGGSAYIEISSLNGVADSAVKLATARTINGVNFDGTSSIVINAVDSTARIAISEKGIASGVATLDVDGKLTFSQLPTLTKSVVGLGNVDNTSDAAKPVSVAQTTAIANAQSAAQAASAPIAHVGSGGSAHSNVVAAGASGFMSGADKTKLDAISGSNTGDETGTTIRSKLGVTTLSGSNTGDQTTITGNAGTATKLATARAINGVSFDGSVGITINAVDSTARVASSEKAVANGVATLDSSAKLIASQIPTLTKTMVGLDQVDNTSDANKPVSTLTQTAITNGLATKVSTSLLGAVNGVATLDGSGLIPSSQLPGFVDDVIEASNFAALPATGATGKIYVTIDTNKTYRWSGSAYIEISSLNGTADAAVKLITARTINGVSFDGTANITVNAVDSTTRIASTEKGAANGVATLDVNGKITASQVTAITKADIGLGNVDNTSDASKPVSSAQATAIGNAQSAAQAASTPIAHVGSGGSVHALVTTSTPGFMSDSDKVKLNGMSGSNTGDETGASIRTKLGVTTLSGSNTGDQVNITGNAGTAGQLQTVRTINGVNFDGSANITINAVDSTARIASSEKGAANGVATLDANGKLTFIQIPNFTKADLGLGNVDNTSDVNKPVSTATQTALNAKISTSTIGAPNGTPSLDNNGKLTFSQLPTRILVATVGAFNGTSIIPADNSTPTSTEGTQLLSQALTPENTTSGLHISGNLMLDCGTSNRNLVIACFRGTTCIGTMVINFVSSGRPMIATYDFYDPNFGAIGTSTYSIRFGTATAATWYVNRLASQILNGNMSLNRPVRFEEINI